MKDRTTCDAHLHCGCCGRCSARQSQIKVDGFCNPCHRHLAPTRGPLPGPTYRSPWDRTWFAQYGTDCPYQATLEAS